MTKEINLSIFSDGDEKLQEEKFSQAFFLYQGKFESLKRIYGVDSAIYNNYLLTKVDQLIQTAKIFLKQNKIEQSRMIFIKLIVLLKVYGTSEFTRRKIEILNNLSCCLRRIGRVLESIDLLKQALDIGSKTKENLGLTYVNLSAAYSSMGDLKSALKMSKEGILELSHPALAEGNKELMKVQLIAYYNNGTQELAMGNLQASMKVLDKAKDLGKNHDISDSDGIYDAILDKLAEVRTKFVNNSRNSKEKEKHNKSKKSQIKNPHLHNFFADSKNQGSATRPISANTNISLPVKKVKKKSNQLKPSVKFNDPVYEKFAGNYSISVQQDIAMLEQKSIVASPNLHQQTDTKGNLSFRTKNQHGQIQSNMSMTHPRNNYMPEDFIVEQQLGGQVMMNRSSKLGAAGKSGSNMFFSNKRQATNESVNDDKYTHVSSCKDSSGFHDTNKNLESLDKLGHFAKGKYAPINLVDFRVKPLYLADEYTGMREYDDQGLMVIDKKVQDKISLKCSPYLQNIKSLGADRRINPNKPRSAKSKKKRQPSVGKSGHLRNPDFMSVKTHSMKSYKPKKKLFLYNTASYDTNGRNIFKEDMANSDQFNNNHYNKGMNNGRNGDTQIEDQDLQSWDDDGNSDIPGIMDKIDEEYMNKNRDNFLSHLKDINRRLESVNRDRMLQRMELLREEDKLQAKKTKTKEDSYKPTKDIRISTQGNLDGECIRVQVKTPYNTVRDSDDHVESSRSRKQDQQSPTKQERPSTRKIREEDDEKLNAVNFIQKKWKKLINNGNFWWLRKIKEKEKHCDKIDVMYIKVFDENEGASEPYKVYIFEDKKKKGGLRHFDIIARHLCKNKNFFELKFDSALFEESQSSHHIEKKTSAQHGKNPLVLRDVVRRVYRNLKGEGALESDKKLSSLFSFGHNQLKTSSDFVSESPLFNNEMINDHKGLRKISSKFKPIVEEDDEKPLFSMGGGGFESFDEDAYVEIEIENSQKSVSKKLKASRKDTSKKSNSNKASPLHQQNTHTTKKSRNDDDSSDVSSSSDDSSSLTITEDLTDSNTSPLLSTNSKNSKRYLMDNDLLIPKADIQAVEDTKDLNASCISDTKSHQKKKKHKHRKHKHKKHPKRHKNRQNSNAGIMEGSCLIEPTGLTMTNQVMGKGGEEDLLDGSCLIEPTGLTMTNQVMGKGSGQDLFDGSCLIEPTGLTMTNQAMGQGGPIQYSVIGTVGKVDSEEILPVPLLVTEAEKKPSDVAHSAREIEDVDAGNDPFIILIKDNPNMEYKRLNRERQYHDNKMYNLIYAKIKKFSNVNVIIYAYNITDKNDVFEHYEMSKFLSTLFLNNMVNSKDFWMKLTNDYYYDVKSNTIELKENGENFEENDAAKDLIKMIHQAKIIENAEGAFHFPVIQNQNEEQYAHSPSLPNMTFKFDNQETDHDKCAVKKSSFEQSQSERFELKNNLNNNQNYFDSNIAELEKLGLSSPKSPKSPKKKLNQNIYKTGGHDYSTDEKHADIIMSNMAYLQHSSSKDYMSFNNNNETKLSLFQQQNVSQNQSSFLHNNVADTTCCFGQIQKEVVLENSKEDSEEDDVPLITQMETMAPNIRFNDNYKSMLDNKNAISALQMEKRGTLHAENQDDEDEFDPEPPAITQMQTMAPNFAPKDNFFSFIAEQSRMGDCINPTNNNHSKVDCTTPVDVNDNSSCYDEAPAIVQLNTLRPNYTLNTPDNPQLKKKCDVSDNYGIFYFFEKIKILKKAVKRMMNVIIQQCSQ